MRALSLPPSWASRALVFHGDEVDLSWFTPDEIARSETFRLPKRRHEWLASRYAAKLLAMRKRVCREPRDFDVAVTELNYSISHSHPYAAAALDERPVGIDVQVVRDISEAAAHLFLSDGEAEAMRSLALEHRMIHFWCAKEAAWKQLGGTVETLRRVPIVLQTRREHGLLFDGVETIASGDVVVALTR